MIGVHIMFMKKHANDNFAGFCFVIAKLNQAFDYLKYHPKQINTEARVSLRLDLRYVCGLKNSQTSRRILPHT
jgi:hypothetical protein